MNRSEHRAAEDIGELLRDLKLDPEHHYLDLQRVEQARHALNRWPLLQRIDAILQAQTETPGAQA